ncbi:MAG: DNA cytosine methyltransferase [Campylobacterales bacterium]|nr:DNA cytosine methyltransferase [Campylobacterales bacterium]
MCIATNREELLGLSVLNVGQVRGQNKNTKRIWIANSNITKSFNIGDSVTVDYDKQNEEIIIHKSEGLGNHTISSRSGREPIIDIKNRLVEETLGDVEKVEVRFYKNKAVIRISSKDRHVKERASKNGLNVFEIFSGAGTLSHFFKKAGFNISGALEMCDKYLTMYKRNHGEHIFSVNARLEDFQPNDFPKNIDVALVGIPCNKFSPGNLSMQQALKDKSSESKHIVERYEAEALTFHVLNAIVAMNPKMVVVEEVEEYSRTSAAMMLRTILMQYGYSLNETVSEGKHTKRKRWCLVASGTNKISLDNLSADDGKTIANLLEVPIEHRVWKTAEENIRVSGMLRKGLGIRDCIPSDIKCNAFTTNGTRHTEPILKHPAKELYSEFSTEEIKNIHGLNGFVLSGVKTVDREILGQGVTDMFATIADRVKQELLGVNLPTEVSHV